MRETKFIFNNIDILSKYTCEVFPFEEQEIPTKEYEKLPIYGRNGDFIIDKRSCSNIAQNYTILLYRNEDLEPLLFDLYSSKGYCLLETTDFDIKGIFKGEEHFVQNEKTKVIVSFDCLPTRNLDESEKELYSMGVSGDNYYFVMDKTRTKKGIDPIIRFSIGSSKSEVEMEMTCEDYNTDEVYSKMHFLFEPAKVGKNGEVDIAKKTLMYDNESYDSDLRVMKRLGRFIPAGKTVKIKFKVNRSFYVRVYQIGAYEIW